MTTFYQRDAAGRRRKETRLLVIDDNPDHLQLIKRTIAQCMPLVTPVFAQSEAEAVAYLSDCETDTHKIPRLILLDLYLPTRETGWRVLDHIRTRLSILGKLPVVLLSYSTCRSDITEAYDRGCSSYFAKPLNPDAWLTYFDLLRTYWLETVTLPEATNL
ncbi:response regulator [Fibrivirga algicola]|uniref:Response regulator n=1 Tax=Fibrivirga algicola TaxID=2950420 RepID=A0ABX0QFX0_9BACT|nr:response regulator [Fibrivirga algicola]NID10778.1 response regulator [Fibrivirga algicola]